MVLLLLGALLFFFLSVTTGYVVNKLLRIPTAGTFKNILTGTAGITVYLNILSLFISTNYLLLLPVSILSSITIARTRFSAAFVEALKSNIQILFKSTNGILTISFITVLILFTLVAPYNTDSSGYHFLSILWNEKYKAVPGLANLFPQFGYNSSFLVLSAAFSFTDLTSQSIYPVNPVLIIGFFIWMLKKSFQVNVSRRILLWIFLIITLRQFPINLASPSADAVASILIFYIVFSAYFDKTSTTAAYGWKHLLLLSCFAIIIKLSTLPLLLILFLAAVLPGSRLKELLPAYGKLIPLILLIIAPWIIRNVVLSGYIIFPFPALDFFAFDWKVPAAVVSYERLHIAHAPRMISTDWSYVDSLPIFAWLPVWISKLFVDNPFNSVLVIASLLSPLLLAGAALSKKVNPITFFCWLISYVGILFWMITSPDVRFGYHFMLLCIFLPLLQIADGYYFPVKERIISNVVVTAVVFICLYYALMALKKLTPYTYSTLFIYPLKSAEYFKNKDLDGFKYVLLNNGIKLYIQDPGHHSINAPLPSCSPYRSEIRMRGNKLEDGFKSVP